MLINEQWSSNAWIGAYARESHSRSSTGSWILTNRLKLHVKLQLSLAASVTM
jgi:hypothetical protein